MPKVNDGSPPRQVKTSGLSFYARGLCGCLLSISATNPPAMFDSTVILFWIFCAIVAGAIAHAKGQVAIGVLLGALLGPLGIIFTLFLSNKLQERTQEENLQHSRDLRMRLRLEQIQAQKPVQVPMPRVVVVNAAPQAQVVPPPPGAKVLQSFRIASNGQELGEIALPVIRTMMSAGRLLETDHYFDTVAGEWRTLDQLNGSGGK